MDFWPIVGAITGVGTIFGFWFMLNWLDNRNTEYSNRGLRV